MRIDYVQIKISDLADALSELDKLTDSEAGAIIRKALIDLINVNQNSEFKFVRETIKTTLNNMKR